MHNRPPWERSRYSGFDICVWGPLWLTVTGRERTDVTPWPWHRPFRFMTLICPGPVPLCWSRAMLAQEALCITLHCGQEPCKALPMTDKQCLVWIKRKNKALRIIEADGGNTGLQNESKRRLLLWTTHVVTKSRNNEGCSGNGGIGRASFLPPAAVKAAGLLGQGIGQGCVVAAGGQTVQVE